jgi:hypothetical protein
MQWSSLQKTARKLRPKEFGEIYPWVQSHKTFFFFNLLSLFGKLDLFTAMQQILYMFIKWSSLQESASKFTPN